MHSLLSSPSLFIGTQTMAPKSDPVQMKGQREDLHGFSCFLQGCSDMDTQ